MKSLLTKIILFGLLFHFFNCGLKDKPKSVTSYSFTLTVPKKKYSKGKSNTEQEDVNFTVKIIEKKDDKFSGLLKITSTKNSKWRYVTGRYISKDSLIFNDSLAILDEYYNVPTPQSTRLTSATYSIKLDKEIFKGKLSIIPTRLDSMFDKFLPPKNSAFDGIIIHTDTLSRIENSAWDLFQKEKCLKAKFDSLQREHDTFIFEYDKLPDSVYYSLRKLALEILQTGVAFFEKYQHSPDSIIVQRDFIRRIYNCLQLSRKNENDLKESKSYLSKIQPEGSRFYLTWNFIAHNIESRLVWSKYKMQKNSEFSGKRQSKDEVSSKNITRSQEFYLSVDPNKVHPLEKLNYFGEFAHSIVQYNIGYKDTLLNMLKDAKKVNSHDEEFLCEINRIKEIVDKYVSLNKRLGNAAPNFTATDISGNTINLQSYRNKVVYLDFWTAWCGPCRGSIPKLKSLYEKYNKSGFEIIGIAPDNLEDVKKVSHDEKMTWPQIVPNENNASDLTKVYGVAGYPKGFLIDKKGIVVEIIHPSDERLDFILQQYLLK